MNDDSGNNVYLTLDDKKSDEFILKQNLDALKKIKNDEMTRITQDLVSIPATLRLTRKLSEGHYRTSNVTCVALDEEAPTAPSV